MKQLRALISTAVVLAVVVFFAGCRADGKQGSPSAAQQQAGAKKFHIRGIVVSSDAKTGAVTLDTEAIPGYMEAMTMPYTLAQPNIATELHRGDTITATLTVTADADVLDEIDVIAQAKPDYKPAVTYNDLEPGETVPDFAFRNQKRADGAAGGVEGQGGAADVHLHAVPAAEFLRADEPEFC